MRLLPYEPGPPTRSREPEARRTRRKGAAVPAKPFHLAWFMNFVADEWRTTWGSGAVDWTGDFYVEMGKALERACFDYIILEDKLMVSDAYGGTMEHDLKHGVNPKHDPVPLAVL